MGLVKYFLKISPKEISNFIAILNKIIQKNQIQKNFELQIFKDATEI